MIKDERPSSQQHLRLCLSKFNASLHKSVQLAKPWTRKQTKEKIGMGGWEKQTKVKDTSGPQSDLPCKRGNAI
jgi:hypothetical protein